MCPFNIHLLPPWGGILGMPPPPPRDDLWLSNTTGIIRQKNPLYHLICILGSSHYVIT